MSFEPSYSISDVASAYCVENLIYIG
uniref:Uncharacterized protein n=1 Tax=Anguilla anguilla TaxID=7936 RepID=A0A0E9PGE9_ANGAN